MSYTYVGTVIAEKTHTDKSFKNLNRLGLDIVKQNKPLLTHILCVTLKYFISLVNEVRSIKISISQSMWAPKYIKANIMFTKAW